MEKVKKGKGGCGIGFLIFLKYEYGWLVIINNYVIMNVKEVEGVKVVFDYFKDFINEGFCIFMVLGVLFIFDCIRFLGDVVLLDYSLLIL